MWDFGAAFGTNIYRQPGGSRKVQIASRPGNVGVETYTKNNACFDCVRVLRCVMCGSSLPDRAQHKLSQKHCKTTLLVSNTNRKLVVCKRLPAKGLHFLLNYFYINFAKLQSRGGDPGFCCQNL